MNKKKLNLQQFADEAGVLSKGTTLSYKKEDSYVKVAGVKSIPQIGSDPERIDVTDLSSEKRQYIAGLQDVDNLEFAVVYRTAEFATFQSFAESASSATEFKIEYPDGMTVGFKGEPAVRIGATEVNGALEYTIVIVVSDGPDITPVA